MTRAELMAELEAAKREFQRCLGGVDPAGCVAASRRITELRNALRDDVSLFEHFQKVANEPPAPKRRRRR